MIPATMIAYLLRRAARAVRFTQHLCTRLIPGDRVRVTW